MEKKSSLKSCAVIGLGRFGRAAAAMLYQSGCEVLAVDKDEELAEMTADYCTRAVVCDAKSENALKSLGISDYPCVIVAIGNSLTDSVLVTFLLKEMGVKTVICKATDENHRRILLKIGADHVVIPEHEMGVKLAMSLVSGRIAEYTELSDVYGIAEIPIPSSWEGKSLAEVNVRKKYSVSVIGIRSGGVLNVNPSADCRFRRGDAAVIIGENEALNRLSLSG